MRKLKTASGKTLKAPEGFRYYRDDLPTREPAIKAQRKRFETIFRDLRSADIERRSLYLAWDFTVASDENIAGRLLHMRDEAFAELGDTKIADGVAQGDCARVRDQPRSTTSPRSRTRRGAPGARAPSRCPAT